MEEQILEIGIIQLVWSDWMRFEDVKVDSRKSDIKLPKSLGVYEVIHEDSNIRLTIGKGNIYDRLKGLVRGTTGHSAGVKIKAAYPDWLDRMRFLVRYAQTDRPAAAEEELHRLHILEHGHLPLHTDR